MIEGKNRLEYEKISNKLNELKELTERVEKNLLNMNELITETVDQGIGIWDGESANQFRTSWSNVENELPSYVDVFQKQINNIHLMIEKTKQNDK